VTGAGGSGRPRRSQFRAGELVRVRSAEEIQATLDEDGLLDGLPFMPEMTRLCGETFRVRASAHKTCASHGALRSMDAAVFLEGSHCDGSAHGGCQARCPLFWKDAWLAPAGNVEPPAERTADERLERKAARSVRLHGRDPRAGTYSCQATELLAATVRLPYWSIGQYRDDLRSGNLTLGALVPGIGVSLFNKFQLLTTRFLPPRLRIRGGRRYPNIVGTLTRTPDVRLGIEPGEIVEIRSHEEILGTLDAESRNRGLGFDFDMVPYCGRRSKVLHRVERIIDEATGELVQIRNPCLVLDGVVCRGRYHRFCPRALDSYWREAWLRPVEADPAGRRSRRDEAVERRPASTITSA
jgi:hypothetical protein